ncbi:hypothetical protein D3C87_1705150 [compost metagenome]
MVDLVEVIPGGNRRHQHVGELCGLVLGAQGAATGTRDARADIGVLHRHADGRGVVPATFAGVPDMGEVGHGVGDFHVQIATDGAAYRYL